MNNDPKRSLFERFYSFMERDTRAVEILTYGIAGAGLIAAMYKIKPISKFHKATDVPFRFIVRKVKLQGSVTRVEMNNGATIYVDHKPLITLPRFGMQNDLPIKIEGVDVNMNGLSWLQTIVVGKNVNFIPIRRERDILGCIISMPQQNKEPLHLGEELVKLGFGTIRDVEPEILDAKLKQSYQHSLESAQKSAKRKRNGVWHFKIPPTLMWKIQSQISNQVNSVLPSFVAKRFSL